MGRGEDKSEGYTCMQSVSIIFDYRASIKSNQIQDVLLVARQIKSGMNQSEESNPYVQNRKVRSRLAQG